MLELGIAEERIVPLQKRIVGSTNISDVFDGVNHIWPTRDDVAYFYDFDSILLRFLWTDDNGKDFDTGTNITNAPGVVDYVVGYSWGSSENRTQPFLYWGGDNTDSGAECVMIDIKSIQDVYTEESGLTMPELLIVKLRGNWYSSKYDGIVTVECTAYKGGTIVKSYLVEGSSVGVHDQYIVFADKDGWIFETGMSKKLWIGEVFKQGDTYHKINLVDDSIEGIPNFTVIRSFVVGDSLYSSTNGYVTINGKLYKVWNQQINFNGNLIKLTSAKIFDNISSNTIGELSVVVLNEDGSLNSDEIHTEFHYGYVAGNSEKKGKLFIRSYVYSAISEGPAEEEFAVVNYFDKTEAGQVVALNSTI